MMSVEARKPLAVAMATQATAAATASATVTCTTKCECAGGAEETVKHGMCNDSIYLEQPWLVGSKCIGLFVVRVCCIVVWVACAIVVCWRAGPKVHCTHVVTASTQTRAQQTFEQTSQTGVCEEHGQGQDHNVHTFDKSGCQCQNVRCVPYNFQSTCSLDVEIQNNTHQTRTHCPLTLS